MHPGKGFIGSSDVPCSESSRIADPDPRHLNGTHPGINQVVLESTSYYDPYMYKMSQETKRRKEKREKPIQNLISCYLAVRGEIVPGP